MNDFFYSFGGATTGSYTGFGNVFVQQQVDPTILRIMQIANTDPVVNAFCRANGITTAKHLQHVLLQEGKKRYEQKLKTYSQDYLQSLVPEPERDYDPDSVRHKHSNHDFESYYIQLDDEHSVYQCSCGMLVIDEDPKSFADEGSGHSGYATWNKQILKDLPPRQYKTTLTIKTELIELDSSDGVTYSIPEPSIKE